MEKPINLKTLSRNLVDKSVAVIRRSEEDQRPFLLYHSFAHTHTPLATQDRWDSLCSESRLKLLHQVGRQQPSRALRGHGYRNG